MRDDNSNTSAETVPQVQSSKQTINLSNSVHSVTDYAYKKNKRLNQKDRFVALLQTKPICKTDLFYAHAILNDVGYARLGMIIAKRFCKKAHDRNKIKRYMREYFRLNIGINNVDILLRLKANVVKPNFNTYAEYKKQLEAIFSIILART
jgi:ribonuclease P protein component